MKHFGKLIALLAFSNLLFIAQPIHLDDNGMLQLARNVAANPVKPYSGTGIFFGQELPFAVNTHPPLFVYFLAAVLKLTPTENIAILRLAMFLPTLLCASGVIRLVSRFSSNPWVLAFVTIFSPAFLVVSHSLLSDLMFTGLLLWSVEFYLAEANRPSAIRLALSSSCLALACLISYQGVLLLPALWVYEFLTSRKGSRALTALLGPALALTLWSLHLHVAYQGTMFASSASLYANLKHSISQNLIAYLSHLGGGGPLWFFVLGIVVLILRRRYVIALTSLACSLLAYLLATPSYTGWYALMFIVMCWCGMTVALAAITSVVQAVRALTGNSLTPQQALNGFLGSWIIAFYLPFGVVTPFITTRYCLPVLVPSVLLLARIADLQPILSRKFIAVILVLVSAALGMLISTADYLMAQVNPAIVPRLIEEFPWLRGQLWYVGEFGLRYYLERAQVPNVRLSETTLPAGDVIVCSRYVGLGLQDLLSAELFSRSSQLGTLTFDTPLPFRTLNVDVHAGFYCHYSGFLPWSYGQAPLEQVLLYRIEPKLRTSFSLEQSMSNGVPHSEPALTSWTAQAPERAGYRTLIFETLWELRSAGSNRFATSYLLANQSREWQIQHDWQHGPLEPALYKELIEWPIPQDADPGLYTLHGAITDKIAERTYSLEPRSLMVMVPAVLRSEEPADYLNQLAERRSRFASFTSVLAAETSCAAQFLQATEIAKIVLFSRLGNALDLPQGQPVVAIGYEPPDSLYGKLQVRAGIETAEWSADRPEHVGRMKHEKPLIGYSFSVGEQNGYQGHIYRYEWEFEPPLKVTKLTLTQGSVPCVTIIDALILYSP